jgi:hypothetical protein
MCEYSCFIRFKFISFINAYLSIQPFAGSFQMACVSVPKPYISFPHADQMGPQTNQAILAGRDTRLHGL